MPWIRFLLLIVALALPALGGCSQRLAVEGRGDRLYAEAQGAMESEGFRPVGRGSDLPGAKGSDPRQGRLQFLYYADNLAPTIVEIRIEPGANEMTRTVRVPAEAVVVAPGAGAGAGAAASADAVRAGAVRGREGCGSGGACGSDATKVAVDAPPVLLAIDPAVKPVAATPAATTPTTRTALTSSAGTPASVARVEPVVSPNGAPLPYAPDLFGAHRVIVTAWSSLTYAPDPFIADLAVNVLRRAYLLSGNVR